MDLRTVILGTAPTSYWPLTDDGNGLCHDEMKLNDATSSSGGVKLAAIPFGSASVPYFDGAIGSTLTVADAPQYSQPYANALSVAAWICPLVLDNLHTAGATDQHVHFLEKAVEFPDKYRMGIAALQSDKSRPPLACLVLYLQSDGIAGSAQSRQRRLYGVWRFNERCDARRPGQVAVSGRSGRGLDFGNRQDNRMLVLEARRSGRQRNCRQIRILSCPPAARRRTDQHRAGTVLRDSRDRWHM